MTKLWMAVACLSMAACSEGKLSGIYVGPPYPAAPGTSLPQEREYTFFEDGRLYPRLVTAEEAAQPDQPDPWHYRLRGDRLAIEGPGGEEAFTVEVGDEFLVLDGQRWERLDGRLAGALLDGRYVFEESIPGISTLHEELQFLPGGHYRSERRVTSYTPPGEEGREVVTGSYRSVGDSLELTPDGGEVYRESCLAGFFQGRVPSALYFADGRTMWRTP